MRTGTLLTAAFISLGLAGAAQATSPAPFPAGLLVDAQHAALHPAAKRVVGAWFDTVARDSRIGGGGLQVVAAAGRDTDFTVTDPANHTSLRVAWHGKQLTVEERCTRRAGNEDTAMTSRCWIEQGSNRGPIAWVKGSFTPHETVLPGGPVGFAGQRPQRYVGLRVFGKSFVRTLGH